MNKETIKGKKRARKMALQALYQWHMSGNDLYEIDAQYTDANNMDKVDAEYFRILLYGIPKELTKLEEAFLPFLDRAIKELNPIELTVLRLSAYEIMFRPELPYKVILDESINLTKEFGSQDGHRYVNGVLHHLAKSIRNIEIQNEKSPT